MKRSTSTALAALAAVVGTTSFVAAKRLVETRTYAAPTVISAVTSQVGQFTYRAVSGIDRNLPYLAIEQLAWAGGTGQPTIAVIDRDLRDALSDRNGARGTLKVSSQRAIAAVTFGRTRVQLSSLRYITVDSAANGRFNLSAFGARSTYRCTLTTNAAEAACTGTWEGGTGGYDGGGINPNPQPTNPGGGYDGGGINPQPTNPGGGYDGGGINPQPGGGNAGQIEELRVATIACNNLLSVPAQRETCIKTYVNAKIEMGTGVTACGRAFATGVDRLACVTKVSTSRIEPGALVDYCRGIHKTALDITGCIDRYR